MKKLILLSIFLIPIAVILNSCKNETPPFVPKERPLYSWSETKCLVDGKEWGDCNLYYKTQPKTTVLYWQWNNRLLIEGTNYCADTSTSIYIVLHGFYGDTGKYELSDYSYGGYIPGAFKPPLQTTSQNIGYCYLTEFDTAKKVVQGTFYFEAVNDTLGKKVTITKGSITTRHITIE